jgi:hypothetical protein
MCPPAASPPSAGAGQRRVSRVRDGDDVLPPPRTVERVAELHVGSPAFEQVQAGVADERAARLLDHGPEAKAVPRIVRDVLAHHGLGRREAGHGPVSDVANDLGSGVDGMDPGVAEREWAQLEPVRAGRGPTVIPTDTPDTMPQPALIVVPGRAESCAVLSDEVLVGWLRTAAPGCQWTASVCTGAGLYAAAGLLEGKKTNTHRGFRDNLRAMGREVIGHRVV